MLMMRFLSALPIVSAYYTVPDLPETNLRAAMGNPLKGLIGGSRWSSVPLREDYINLSMESFSVGLSEVMVGDNIFDWDLLDGLIQGAASRTKHSVMSFYIHWPGQELMLPQYLRDEKNVTILPTEEYGDSLDYQNADLQLAIHQFITALGQRYDGDMRIAAVHISVVGFWGEFHTGIGEEKDHLTKETQTLVLNWFLQAFNNTQLQARYPDDYSSGFGLGFADFSFAYSTVGPIDWYFYPRLVKWGEDLAWRSSMMGGETRPELQDSIFTSNYTTGLQQQDFFLCAEVTHMSYMLHHRAFASGVTMENDEVERARDAHAFLGYNFQVTNVSVSESAELGVDVTVTIQQVGIAPFYFDLGVELRCHSWTGFKPGVNELINATDSKQFEFLKVPKTDSCLSDLSLHLVSSRMFEGTTILFAQGNDGYVRFMLPLPDGETFAPSSTPSLTPTSVPLVTGSVELFIRSDDEPNGDFSYSQDGSVYGVDENSITAPIGYDDGTFQFHRWAGGAFSCTISRSFASNTNYFLKIGFIELYEPNCEAERRVMQVNVNGIVAITKLDVYNEAPGCRVGLVKTLEVVTDPKGHFVVEFVGLVQNPMFTFIEVLTAVPATQEPSYSEAPSTQPNEEPSVRPSEQPSSAPSSLPSGEPSHYSETPSTRPSEEPSSIPSARPSEQPSSAPSSLPRGEPSRYSEAPSTRPSEEPFSIPSARPSENRSSAPSSLPTGEPSHYSEAPSTRPTRPSEEPSSIPSARPTEEHSSTPSSFPSGEPSRYSEAPSTRPSEEPSSIPSARPTKERSSAPSSLPSGEPSHYSGAPSTRPSEEPASIPSARPSEKRSPAPSSSPSGGPSRVPTRSPSLRPQSDPDAMVQVEGKGQRRMRDLAIGDSVLSSTDGRYSEVYAFGHYLPHYRMDYIQFFVQGQLDPLVISSNHLLFVDGSNVPVKANKVEIGQSVYVGGTLRNVTTLLDINQEGVFAPFTFSGTIVVNNVLASSYATPGESHWLEFSGLRLSWHHVCHAYTSPLRIFCKIFGCRTEEGKPYWVSLGLQIYQYLDRCHVAMTLGVPSILMVSSSFQAIEFLL